MRTRANSSVTLDTLGFGAIAQITFTDFDPAMDIEAERHRAEDH